MKQLEKFGLYLLAAAFISDFLNPYVLGLFYPGFQQSTMLISHLGAPDSPVKGWFDSWSVVSGSLFLFCLPAVYQVFCRRSKSLAWLLVLAIGLFGLTDCIFTGVFSVNESKKIVTAASLIHDYGSGLGFFSLMLAPYFLARAACNQPQRRNYIGLFLLTLLTTGIYGSPALYRINLPISLAHRGFWQRLNLFCLYLPLAYMLILYYQKNHTLKGRNSDEKISC